MYHHASNCFQLLSSYVFPPYHHVVVIVALVSAYNDAETRNGFYKSDADDRQEYFKKLHNVTKEPSLKFKMREVKRMMDEEAAEKAKKAEESK